MSSEHIFTKEEFDDYGNRLHLNTVIDIFANGFAAFVVLKFSTPAMGNYKYYILLTIFCAFLMDFHMTFIFGPFLMLPAPILCGAGFICKHLNVFWGQFIQYGIMHITISCVGFSLISGLLYQLFSLNGNIKFFHSIKGIIIIFLIMILYPMPSYAILLIAYDYDATDIYIKENFPSYYSFYSSIPSCHGMKLDFRTKAHYGVLAFQVFLVWAGGIFGAYKIHQKLNSMKNILSAATLKARRQLLISLCFQMTIPFIFIVFPLVLILLSIIADVKFVSFVETEEDDVESEESTNDEKKEEVTATTPTKCNAANIVPSIPAAAAITPKTALTPSKSLSTAPNAVPNFFSFTAENQVKLSNLISKGYPETEALAAFRAAYFDQARAVEYLINGIPSNIAAAASNTTPQLVTPSTSSTIQIYTYHRSYAKN